MGRKGCERARGSSEMECQRRVHCWRGIRATHRSKGPERVVGKDEGGYEEHHAAYEAVRESLQKGSEDGYGVRRLHSTTN